MRPSLFKLIYLLVTLLCVVILFCSIRAVNADTVIYDFTQDGCPPCRQMEPIIQSMQADGIPVKSIHISNPLAQSLKVTGTPTFVLYDTEARKPIARIVGATDRDGLLELWKLRPGVKGTPKAAWRYEQTSGHRSALVCVWSFGRVDIYGRCLLGSLLRSGRV